MHRAAIGLGACRAVPPDENAARHNGISGANARGKEVFHYHTTAKDGPDNEKDMCRLVLLISKRLRISGNWSLTVATVLKQGPVNGDQQQR